METASKQMRFLVLLLVCAGCQSPRVVPVVSQDRQASRAAMVKTAVAPQPARTFGLIWDNNYDTPGTVTEIHQTTDLTQPFRYLTETTNGQLRVTVQHSAQFFIIRNRAGNDYSDWCRK